MIFNLRYFIRTLNYFEFRIIEITMLRIYLETVNTIYIRMTDTFNILSIHSGLMKRKTRWQKSRLPYVCEGTWWTPSTWARITLRRRLHRSRCSSKAFVPSHRYQGIYRGVTRDRDNRNRMIHVCPPYVHLFPVQCIYEWRFGSAVAFKPHVVE